MKFTHALVALVATVAQAKPLEMAAQYEEAGQLAKRADASFTVFTNDDCTGTSNTYSISGDGAKGNFPGARRGIRLSGIGNGFHITLYSAVNQGGIKDPRLNEGNINQCWHAGTNAWLSYGLFNDN
ncbi:hypothetical protein SAMD00023353_0101780 [Rosellinia necatrix]|uniref:Uncharacterized protein n=1 Tax=Rosellinia necatrix TaxID=77044 RepID=A0A1S7UIC6_ROSNE|nr:hypothetical protein SAMD00023353_0101780 [Rosellinia necatrix]